MEIIAECGCNWKTLNEAFEMIKECGRIGIKYAKFQLWKKEQAPEAVHCCYLDEEKAKTLFEFGRNIGVEVFFSVFYPEAVDICERIGVNYYKIRYADRNNYEICGRVRETGKNYFVSFAGRDPTRYVHDNMIPLYCIPKYPADFMDYSIGYLDSYFSGISDHTPDTLLYEKWGRVMDYWEMHVCLTKDCYEAAWSKTFEEIEKWK